MRRQNRLPKFFGNISTLQIQKMNLTISDERAGEIALALIKEIWPNRGLDLTPEEFSSRLEGWEKKTRISKFLIAYFIAKELLPITYCKCSEILIEVSLPYAKGAVTDYSPGKIALALLQQEHTIDFRNHQDRLKRISSNTNIPMEELNNFYIQLIFPHYLSVAAGKPLKIVEDNKPPE